jgi:hypothetical protein
VGLVVTIFLQLPPGANVGPLRVTFGTGMIVVASTFVSNWLTARGRSWAATGASFIGTGAINFGVAFALGLLPGRGDGDGTALPLAVVLLGLLTLLVVLYDRFWILRRESSDLIEVDG